MRDSSAGEATYPDDLDTTDRRTDASARAGEVAPKRYFLGTHRTCSPTETLARLRPLLPSWALRVSRMSRASIARVFRW